MMAEQINLSLSELSLHSSSSASEAEDWDRSLNLQSEPELPGSRTPRNLVVFPADALSGEEALADTRDAGKPKRTLSELLKLHAENGKDVAFSPEEASRIAEVLGQWINSGPSPYESEDDFFTRSLDDSALTAKRTPSSSLDAAGRPRGQSESCVNANS